MFTWILAVIVCLIVVGFMKLVSGPVKKSLAGREARLSDSLVEFGGSYGADRVLGPKSEEGIVRLYERMCVIEPDKWENDPRIPSIVRRYKDIIYGREADTEGRNVPSATLLGRPNPDYSKYLKNQQKHVGNAWAHAVKAQKAIIKENKIREGFNDVLLQMGMPEKLVAFAVTDKRLETYTEEQWKAVVKAMQSVCEKYDELLAVDMLTQFAEAELLCSEEVASTFDALCKQDVPFTVSRAVVYGEITMDQAKRAMELVEDWGYGWEEAVEDIMRHDAKEKTATALRDKYARQVNPRA